MATSTDEMLGVLVDLYYQHMHIQISFYIVCLFFLGLFVGSVFLKHFSFWKW